MPVWLIFSLLCCCWPLDPWLKHRVAPQHTNPSLTSVEDVPVPEAEHLSGAVPLLQGRWELRRRDVQVHRHQWDADQADMDPPLSHLEPSDGGGLIPASVRDGVTGTHSQQVWQLAFTRDRRRAREANYLINSTAEERYTDLQCDTLNYTCVVFMDFKTPPNPLYVTSFSHFALWTAQTSETLE